MRSSISVGNSTNDSFYRRHGQRSTLLIHPHGLKVLEFYARLKQAEQSEGRSSLVDSVAEGLESVLYKREPEISTKLREILNLKIKRDADEDCYLTVTGENDETVSGELSQSTTLGNPDAAVRMAPLGLSGTVENQKLARMIIEVSVDKNGGEKKVGQAFDYASLIDAPNETMLLFTLHIDRRKPEQLKIIEEAFLYVHSEEESERKMGFLWREVYQKFNEALLSFSRRVAAELDDVSKPPSTCAKSHLP
jgi:hypothetical protein